MGCPVADDAVLCLSELASNSVVHSASRQPGGTFTVRARVREGEYVRIEVEDAGGPWNEHAHGDSRLHGLGIVRELAGSCGIRGNASTGWIAWAQLSWPAFHDIASAGAAVTSPGESAGHDRGAGGR